MRIGILGGGQLGRMLWEASKALSPTLSPSPVFHETRSCPAGTAGAEIVEGSATNPRQLAGFFDSVDTFAIENEFLPLANLRMWKDSQFPHPSWLALEIAQDKLEQKKFFVRQGFPTAEFLELTGYNMTAVTAELHQSWGGFVLKKARLGYDGKGNLAMPPGKFDCEKLKSFCEAAFQSGSRVYAEKFIPFQKELAVVSVRSFAGDLGHYPLIETVQKNGVCLLAFTAQNLEREQERALQIVRTIAQQLKLLGTFAVEFFLDPRGEVIVNEMAPRVHNSGHFTQTAAASSQFEMHLKSYYLKTFDKADFKCAESFAMINLLGPPGITAPVRRPASASIYWYDKESTSPGRKLGHIIMKSNDRVELPNLIKQLQESESRWQESLKQT